MNPDLLAGIDRLEKRGILPPEAATLFSRVARRELVSVQWELRALLYGGILLITSGVGLFLKREHERIGPVAIATLLAAAAAACLVYVARRSPRFTWGEAPPAHVAVDYVLLLGALLLASDLAYVERQFDLLGPSWPYHLLVVSLVYFLLAYRFDSRAVLSLALTSFAAWRGVSAWAALGSVAGAARPVVRANALFCGVLLLAAGIASVRMKRKPHFETVWIVIALALLFGGLLSGVFQDHSWPAWLSALGAGAAAVLLISYRHRRSLYFAMAAVAAYIGLLRPLSETLHGAAGWLVIALTSLAVVAFLVRAHRRMREGA